MLGIIYIQDMQRRKIYSYFVVTKMNQNSEMTKMIKLVDKIIKADIITIF